MRKWLNWIRRIGWRRFLALLGVLALIGVPIANEVVRRVGASYLGSVIDGQATIAKVELGIRQLRVEGLVVWSPGCREPTLSVEALSADVSLWNGLRNGIWLESIVVDRPVIQLHHDADGQLLTKLPVVAESETESAPIATLPFHTVEVNNARFVIRQEGRTPFDVDNITVCAQAMDQHLTVVGAIPRLFHGRCDFHSTLDIATLKADSDLKYNGLATTSEELAAFPFVPPMVNVYSWSASASLALHQSGSITNLQEMEISLQLRDLALSLEERDHLVRARVDANLSAGAFDAELSGSALGGVFDLSAKAYFAESESLQTSSLHLKGHCDGLSTHSLPAGLIPENLACCLNGRMDLNAQFSDNLLQLSGSSISTVDETNVFGVHVAPTTAEARIDGKIDFNDNPRRSDGTLRMTVASEGVSLDQLSASGLRRFPRIDKTAADDTPLSRAPQLPDFVQTSGEVRGAARLEIPLASVADPSRFDVRGSVDATGVKVNGVVVSQGTAQFTLDADGAALHCENIRLTDTLTQDVSVMSAIAQAKLSADSVAVAELQIEHLSPAMLARLAGVVDRKVDGTIVVRGTTSCQVDRIRDPHAWRGELTINAQEIEFDSQPLADGSVTCVLRDGKMVLQKLDGSIAGGEMLGSGVLELTTPLPFHGHFELRDVDLRRLDFWATRSHTPSIEGTLNVAANASGEATENTWQAAGHVIGGDLRFKKRPLETTQLDFVARPNEVIITSPPNGLLGGTLQVEVSGLAGLGNREQNHATAPVPKVVGQLTGVPIATIAKLGGVNERIDGNVSCKFTAASFTHLPSLDAVAVIESAGVAIRNGSVKDIRADLRIHDGHGDAELSALGFGGEGSLRAQADIDELLATPAEKWRQPSDLPIHFLVTANDIELRQLWPVIGKERELRPLQGTITASVERGQAEREQREVATGDVKLSNVRWENVLWSPQLQADVVLRDESVELRRLTGPFAKGRIMARGNASLQTGHRGMFELTATRLSLEKLLAPVDRRGDLAQGLCSVRVQGRLGHRPSGRAIVAMDRGTAGPIAFGSLRVPIDWSLDPRAQVFQWKTTNAGLELGGGRVITNAEGRWNGRLDMTMTASARRVDTGRIMQRKSVSGGGYLDGTMRLSAKRATAAEDFNGTFDATLSDASSLQLPVVSDLTKFLHTIPTTTTYDESRIQGRLGNGVVYLDRVTLAAANAQILAEGTSTLQGRLNLRVMAKTDETGPADQLLELADSPLVMAAPTPLAMVAKANNALKDRVIHLRISGTAARPAIHLEPGRQLGPETIKFFMNQAIGFRSQRNVMSF